LKETRNLCGKMERQVSTRPRNQLLANSGNFGLLNIMKQNSSQPRLVYRVDQQLLIV
jgi:hypothetical protein